MGPRAPRVSVQLLGALVLRRDGRPVSGRSTQRRRVAVLVLLAAAPHHTMARDRILAYLWPEASAERARHQLATTVYELRQVLGEQAIISRGDDLILDCQMVHVDLAEFDAALSRGDARVLVALYRGAVAEGLHVTGAPEFGEWLETTRARYRRAYRAALGELGAQRDAARDSAGATEAWCRLVEDDPCDAGAVTALMGCLVRSGRHAEALRQADAYVLRAQQDFGLDPDPVVEQAADQIRRAAASGLQGPGSVLTAPSRQERSARPGTTVGWALATSLGLTALVLGSGPHGRFQEPVTPAGSPRIGLHLVPSGGDSAASRVNQLLRQYLASELRDAGFVPMTGRDTRGADLQVAGTTGITPTGIMLRLELHARAFQDKGGGVILREGADDDVEALAMAGAHELFSRWPDNAAFALARDAMRGTANHVAALSFMRGELAYRRGRYLDAVAAFSASAAADTSFTLAHLRLSQSILSADVHDYYDREAVGRLEEALLRLGPRDRTRVWSYLYFRRGDAERAEQLARTAVSVEPESVEGWSLLGEVLFHYNPLRGRPVSEASEPFDRALALDPANASVLWHRAMLAVLAGDTTAFLRLTGVLVTLDPDPGLRLQAELMRAIVADDEATVLRLSDRFGQLDDLRLLQVIWRTAVFLGDFDAAERLAHLLMAPQQSRYSQELGRAISISLHFAQGHDQQAEGALDSLFDMPPLVPGEAPARLAAALLVPDLLAPEERGRFMHRAGTAPAAGDYDQCAKGLVAAEGRDFSAVTRALGRLSGPFGQTCAALVWARYDLGSGNPAAALRHLEAAERSNTPVWFGQLLSGHLPLAAATRFTRAEALRALGRTVEAERWYRSLLEFGPTDLAWARVASRRSAALERPPEAPVTLTRKELATKQSGQ